MSESPPRPIFLVNIVVLITVVFTVLYFTLPETIPAVKARRFRESVILEGTVAQRPLLVGVYLMIAIPLLGWAIYIHRQTDE